MVAQALLLAVDVEQVGVGVLPLVVVGGPGEQEDRLAGLDGRRDRLAHADPHHAPGADVEALARLVHVDDGARKIQRIRAFIDNNGIGPFLNDGTQHAQGPVIIHRHIVVPVSGNSAVERILVEHIPAGRI